MINTNCRLEQSSVTMEADDLIYCIRLVEVEEIVIKQLAAARLQHEYLRPVMMQLIGENMTVTKVSPEKLLFDKYNVIVSCKKQVENILAQESQSVPDDDS